MLKLKGGAEDNFGTQCPKIGIASEVTRYDNTADRQGLRYRKRAW